MQPRTLNPSAQACVDFTREKNRREFTPTEGKRTKGIECRGVPSFPYLNPVCMEMGMRWPSRLSMVGFINAAKIGLTGE
jgi:hypothetical protein